MAEEPTTPSQNGNSSSDANSTPSWEQSNPYASNGNDSSSGASAAGSNGNGSSNDGGSPYGSYGQQSSYSSSNSTYGSSNDQSASSAPYGSSNQQAGQNDSMGGQFGQQRDATTGSAGDQVSDLSSPYGQSSSTNPYGQSSSQAGSNPYGQSPTTGDNNPYGQSSTQAAGNPYGQSSSTNPYGQSGAASQNQYSQPVAPSSAPVASPYGAQQPAPAASPYAQPQQYGAQPYTPAVQQGSGMNIMGLMAIIAGGLGLVLALIPFIGIVFGILLGLAGVVLGVLGLTLKKFNAKKGLAIAGTILSVLALIIGIANPFIWSGIVSNSVDSTLSEYDSLNYDVTLELKVTSSGTSPVDIDYSVSSGNSSNAESVDTSEALFDAPMPWETSIDMKLNDEGWDSSSVSLSVTTDDYDTTLTCEVIANGKTIARDSSTGYASCSVYGLYSYISGSTP